MDVIREATESPLSNWKAAGGLQGAEDLGWIVARDLGYQEKERGEPENEMRGSERGTFPDGDILFTNMNQNRFILSYLHSGFSSYKIDWLPKSFIKSALPFAVRNKQKVKG